MTCPRSHSGGLRPSVHFLISLRPEQEAVGKKNRIERNRKKGKETITKTSISLMFHKRKFSLPFPSSFLLASPQKSSRDERSSEAWCPPTPILCWMPRNVKGGIRPTCVRSRPATAHCVAQDQSFYLPWPEAFVCFSNPFLRALWRGVREPAPCLAQGGPWLR